LLALNSGEWIIRFFLFVMVHLVSDCTHLTQCPKLLVRIMKVICSTVDTKKPLKIKGLMRKKNGGEIGI
ncbi:hypothetical protein, partial [Vibrio parahaemolyticus]|uniref:hypothetical protein n=1 Tax=Vibrio parahaemolyticus TaxID=670 RepID=UPI001C30DE03